MQNAYDFIFTYLNKNNKQNEIQSLSSALDSLDRIELVEHLSKYFDYDFNSILTEPLAWRNLKTLSEAIEGILRDK